MAENKIVVPIWHKTNLTNDIKNLTNLNDEIQNLFGKNEKMAAK